MYKKVKEMTEKRNFRFDCMVVEKGCRHVYEETFFYNHSG